MDQNQTLATGAGQIFHIVRVEVGRKALDVQILDVAAEDVSGGQFAPDGLGVA